MSLDPSVFPRSISPASSDSSLTRSRLRGKEDDLKKNKNYRRYASSVERALSLFDTALQEWADYISFLSRLLKALQAHPLDLPVVPHKVLVSKRLSQCLNPTLPSGVHQKALEVYTYVFGLIKSEGLSHDLPLYLPGIAPTLTFASLTVRPLFLSLVETYICPLEPWAIRPALKAILLALLPGLEEETSDDFDPTLRLINKFRDAAGQMDTQKAGAEAGVSGQYFWQCLFLASITSPSRRSGVLAYLNRYLPRLGVTGRRPSVAERGESVDMSGDMLAAANSVIQPEPGLLIRCFASGLSDEQVLVQRSFLDMLVTHLPLSSPILQSRITKYDLQRLVIAAVGVVARRDMSLNRRLWAWLLGPEPGNDRSSFEFEGRNSISDNSKQVPDSREITQSEYFNRFGLQSLAKGLLEMIEQDLRLPSERSRPFRMSLSLMDRWEVGGYIVPTVFIPIMKNVQAFETIAPKGQFDEVFRSASAFFDGVESGAIFSELLELVDWKAGDLESHPDKVLDNLKLANFILENFNVREEDMVLVHVPLLALPILVKVNQLSALPENRPVSRDQRQATSNQLIRAINNLVGLFTERTFLNKSTHEKKLSNAKQTSGIGHEDILNRIHTFYDKSKDSLDLPQLPFSPKQMSEIIVRETHELAISALENREDIFPVQERVNLLIALLKKVPKSRVLRDRRFYLAICNKIQMNQDRTTPASFSVVSSVTSAVTSLYFIHSPGYYVSYEDVSDLIPILVKHLWRFLSPSSPKFHVEAVRCLWHLHSVSWQDHLVEASITLLMVNPLQSTAYHVSSEEGARRYFVLWNHSHHGTYELPPRQVNDVGKSFFYHSSMLERPLFIILDLLSQGANEASQAVQMWLQDLPSIHKVFRIVISKLDALFLRAAHNAIEGHNLAVSADNYKECNYLLHTISEVISALSPNAWMALLHHTLDDKNKNTSSASEEHSEARNVNSTIFNATLKVVGGQRPSVLEASIEGIRLQQTSLSLMRQLLLGPGAEELADSGVDTFLVEQLVLVLEGGGSVVVQGAIIDALLAALKVRFAQAYLPPPPPRPKHQRTNSRDRLTSPSLLSFTSDKADKGHSAPALSQPPQQLMVCLIKGISSPNSREILDKWILLLCEVLVPLYSSAIFHILMKLVECFCKEIKSSYENLQLGFKQTESWLEDRAEHVTIALLTGLETCIGTAHERLLVEESHPPVTKTPDASQGFFGNMVSGVFTSDANQTRSSAANNRLTVLLCFQDAVRLCFSIWSWGASERSGPPQDSESMASFQYTSLRMRNRSRRILEHLFTAEALECLETLVEMWTKSDAGNLSLIFDLLHTLDGSRPKIAIPAIFNAIYTRTNPNALDPSRKSALASNITECELAAFLVTYARSLDDDVLDEIWQDCTTFLRDVLSNPFPHRQILPRLVEFAAILGTKLENTNFGDNRRMRRELGDVLLRLLTAVFTSKPFSSDSGHGRKISRDYDGTSATNVGPDDILSILAISMPAFTITLGDSDRVSTATTGISSNVIGPILRSRLFPNNVNRNVLVLLQHIAKVPAAAKSWKKDIADAFNDHRFFSSQIDLVKDGWMNILRQWAIADKDRLSELLARLPPPSTAGLMFGVGASAARLEADRKAQLNLRRIALLILCANDDYFAGELPGLLQKLEDLLAATSSSSPSSATRAEIFMVLRALALKTSTTTLIPFWPLINTELQEAVSAVPAGQNQELYNPYSMLQACKLLDTLLVLAPDDFQLLEWLFVTDTIDAVYPPNRWEPIALADEVSQSLGLQSATSPTSPSSVDATEFNNGTRQPWLTSDWIQETAKDEIVERVLRPFFDRLSIHAFESTYTMSSPDLEGCRDNLLADLFNESTMAN